jgi:hypothetical protein
MVLQRRPRTKWLCIGVAIAIGSGWLSQPQAWAQSTAATGNSDPILTAQLDLPGESLTESAIAPKAMQLYSQAVHELHSGKNAAAERDACLAVQLDGRFADADALAATAALADRRFARALSEADAAVHIDDSDEKAWVILATADNYIAQYSDALDALRHVQVDHWTTWQVAYEWARTEAGLEHPAQTLEWADRAALTAPSSFAPLHLLRASALLAAGRNLQAADELEIYLQLDKNTPKRAALSRELLRIRAKTQRGSNDGVEFNALAN